MFIYFLTPTMLKLPLPDQALIKLDSRELEEISSALLSLNSLANTGLPVLKNQVLLTPLFATSLLTYESSRLNSRPTSKTSEKSLSLGYRPFS